MEIHLFCGGSSKSYVGIVSARVESTARVCPLNIEARISRHTNIEDKMMNQKYRKVSKYRFSIPNSIDMYLDDIYKVHRCGLMNNKSKLSYMH